jgi:hypothetical protein
MEVEVKFSIDLYCLEGLCRYLCPISKVKARILQLPLFPPFDVLLHALDHCLSNAP